MEKDLNVSELKISPAPPLADMPNQQMKAMLTHWISVKGKADVPNQNKIDPFAYPKESLPNILIIEIEEETHRYKTRLAGTAVCEAFGINPTGQYISDAPHINHNATKRLDWCVTQRSHYLTTDNYTKRALKPRKYKSLSLPYKNKKGEISRILSTFMFD